MDSQPKVKVRLEESKRSTLVVVLALFILAFIICIIIAFTASPDMLRRKSSTFDKCKNNELENCISSEINQTLMISITEMNELNQILYLDMTPVCSEKCLQYVPMNFTLYGLGNNHTQRSVVRDKDIYKLSCADSESCESVEVFYVPYIKYEDYFFTLHSSQPISSASGLKFELTYITRDFTLFLVGVKYFFLGLTAISLMAFFIKVRRIPRQCLSFETKTILIMNLSLILFNEPLIGFYRFFFGQPSTILSVFCNAQFCALMLLFWLFSLQHSVKFSCKLTISIVEIVLMFFLFVFLIEIYIYVDTNLRFNPNYDWKSDLGTTYTAIYATLVSLLALYAFWALVLTISTLFYWRSFDTRLKVYRTFNIALMCISIAFIGSGYFRLSEPGPTFLTAVSMFNLYFISLLWFFTPSFSSYINLKGSFDFENPENQI